MTDDVRTTPHAPARRRDAFVAGLGVLLRPCTGALLLGGLAASGCRPATPPAEPTAATATIVLDTAQVAFVAERDGNPEVYLLDLPGGQERRLTRREASDFPMASVGGDVLVISATGEDDAHEESLWRYDAAADTLRPLGVQARTLRHPVVAPDGQSVVFEADFESMRDLYRLTFASGRRERLTDEPLGNFAPTLAPDGQRMAFASSRERQVEVYTMPWTGEGPRGRDLVRLTAFHRDDWAPRWSPDGRWIAFLSPREGPARLFLGAPDGTGTRRLLAASDTLAATTNEGEAVWSPDGTHLAFDVTPQGGGTELWVCLLYTSPSPRD